MNLMRIFYIFNCIMSCHFQSAMQHCCVEPVTLQLPLTTAAPCHSAQYVHHSCSLAECNLSQVGAAIPAPTLDKPSWLQFALSHFVMLRKVAADLEGQNELLCMPVIITASTRASASSLRGTANGESRVKDVHLRPLTDMQMQAVVVSLAKRSKDCLAIPSPLPQKLLLLLQLVGGNPRMLCQTLCLLAGSTVVHNEEFPAGSPNKYIYGVGLCAHGHLCTQMAQCRTKMHGKCGCIPLA